MSRRTKHYWLVKSEPHVFSFDDLLAAKGAKTPWDGVRNYQARNLMRDHMKPGDGVLYYHSNADPVGVVGLAEVASEPYPDELQFDPDSKYFDDKATPESPRWILVDIRAVRPLERLVSLAELKAEPALEAMEVVRKGSRLSVQPVRPAEWRAVLGMARRKPRAAPN